LGIAICPPAAGWRFNSGHRVLWPPGACAGREPRFFNMKNEGMKKMKSCRQLGGGGSLLRSTFFLT